MMKKLLLAALAASLLFALHPFALMTDTASAYGNPHGTAYYVAPDGSDSNKGTKNKPFRTLEKARDTIRALKAKKGLPRGGVTVYLREGRYERTASFELNAQDSGKPASRSRTRLIRVRRSYCPAQGGLRNPRSFRLPTRPF